MFLVSLITHWKFETILSVKAIVFAPKTDAVKMATGTTTSTSFTPALTPPPGTTSKFEHPETLKRPMNIAMGVAIPLITIFFFTRAYVRIWIKRQWISEDCMEKPAYSLSRPRSPLFSPLFQC